jgi:hypothetical protein
LVLKSLKMINTVLERMLTIVLLLKFPAKASLEYSRSYTYNSKLIAEDFWKTSYSKMLWFFSKGWQAIEKTMGSTDFFLFTSPRSFEDLDINVKVHVCPIWTTASLKSHLGCHTTHLHFNSKPGWSYRGFYGQKKNTYIWFLSPCHVPLHYIFHLFNFFPIWMLMKRCVFPQFCEHLSGITLEQCSSSLRKIMLYIIENYHI